MHATQTAERRAHTRYDIPLALDIDTATRAGRFAVARNVSSGGLLFQTPSHFRQGEALHLTLLLPRGLAIIADGRVLRSCAAEASSAWRVLVAVQFDQPIPLLDDVLRTLVGRRPSSGATRIS